VEEVEVQNIESRVRIY